MTYEGDLWGYLSAIVSEAESGHEHRWSGALSAEEYASITPAYERAEDFAAAVFTGAETLIAPSQPDLQLEQELQRARHWPGYLRACFIRMLASNMGPEERERFFAQLRQEEVPAPEDEASPLRPVWERLCIDLAWEAISKGEEAVERIFELYGLICRTKPCPATQKFLAHLGRCYVWGFDSECVILCRAVLDTAFGDVVSDEVCEKHFGKRQPRQFGVKDRISAAWKAEIIDAGTKKLADAIIERGNKAIHYQPDITKKVFDTICETLKVLEKIYDRK